MTKEEYIKKQKDILERAIEDTFNTAPSKIILKAGIMKDSKAINHFCGACKNNKFYMSHIKPRTSICSNCYNEDTIQSNYFIILDTRET